MVERPCKHRLCTTFSPAGVGHLTEDRKATQENKKSRRLLGLSSFSIFRRSAISPSDIFRGEILPGRTPRTAYSSQSNFPTVRPRLTLPIAEI